ncbi:MAG: hypothetical protein D6732_26615 [Methanobacteriota archaeon]|nr:MAG: hypothetical protein D6732_26615 [Euryarchaeota archaeon]
MVHFQISSQIVIFSGLILFFRSIAAIVPFFTYRKYRYVGHLWVGISFSFILLSFVFSKVVTLLIPDNLVFVSWAIANVLLMAGILLIIFVSLINQYDRLPIRAHFITALTGILIGLLTSRSNVEINVDKTGITAIYSPSVGLFSIILLSLFLGYIFRPLILKLKMNKLFIKRPHVIMLVVAYFLIVVWVALTPFTSNDVIRQFRPLIFSFGVMIWSLSLLTNPLTLAFTTTTVNTAIIANKTGIPLVSVDMKSGEEIETTLLMGVLSAIKTSMESIVGDTGLKSIFFQDSLLFFIPGKYTILIFILSGNASTNLELLGRYYLQNFEKKYRSDLETTKDVVYPEVFEEEINHIRQIVHEIYV